MNFTENDRVNKIKQQEKAIKAEITKKKLAILKMRRYIKDKNKLYNDLTNEENELSTTITFSSPPIEKTEEELKEEIVNKIVRDRFLEYQDRVNYGDKEKDINLQNQKSNKFQQIQKKRASYYDVRTLVYFLPYMFLVEDDRKQSYSIAIPAEAEDCFNLLEYLPYDNMMDIINKLGYNIIPNLHVNTSELKKNKSESYYIPKSKVPFFNMLTTKEIELLFSSMQIEFSTDHFKPHYKYENMSNTQIQFILKMISFYRSKRKCNFHCIKLSYRNNDKYKESFKRKFCYGY
jgi:hypothetical protein